jgi:hypothetical protein
MATRGNANDGTVYTSDEIAISFTMLLFAGNDAEVAALLADLESVSITDPEGHRALMAAPD